MKRLVLAPVVKWLAEHPRWMVAGAILYFLSPIDLLPEAFVGPWGYLDDILVMLLPLVIREYAKRLQRKHDVYDTTIDPGST
jgi:uncharacterized membrane protein YkvA (DUF1232 family)